MPKKEAERRVSQYLDRERHNRPTARQISEATGVPLSSDHGTEAWKEYMGQRGPDPPRRRRRTARSLVRWIYRLMNREYDRTSPTTPEQAAEAYTLWIIAKELETTGKSYPEDNLPKLFPITLEQLEDACPQDNGWYYPRHEARSFPLDPLPGRDEEERAERLLERQRVGEWVRGCIDKLSDPYRTILLLHDIEELDSEEVASRLSMAREEVQPLLHQAREALGNLLGPPLGEQPEEGSPPTPISTADHPALLSEEPVLPL
jgi:hypothetical protein